MIESNEKEVNSAINQAKKAFESWAFTTLEERLAYIFAFQKALEKQKDRFALTISSEVGKPLWESLSEVASMIAKGDISLKAYLERTGEVHEVKGPPQFALRHRPHGVVAVFGPFNFPGHLPCGHIIPALLAGNTIVFKPSEKTQQVGRSLSQIWEEVGLPNGVLNLVQGGKTAGHLLATHPHIDGLFFTGSYTVGRKLNELFANTPGKILALELGGNNPLIVWSVKDISAAVYTTIISAFLTSGQRCTAARRLIIPKNSSSEQFLEYLQEAIKKIVVGSHTMRPEPFMGPLISIESAQNVLEQEKILYALGAKPLIPLKNRGDAFLMPGLIDVTPINIESLPDEEIFGPLLQVIRVSTFDEAIKVANHTKYGLVSSILTDDRELYKQFFLSAKAGLIHWNAPTSGATSKAPFGGIGCSGNLRPSGFYAADYCAYPVVSFENEKLTLPEQLHPGIEV